MIVIMVVRAGLGPRLLVPQRRLPSGLVSPRRPAWSSALGMRPLVAHCHLGLGKLYRRIGKHEQAQEHLATATTMYREMGMMYWLAKTEKETGESR